MGTASLKHYEFRLDRNNNDTWTKWKSTRSKLTRVRITRLNNGVIYAFQVRTVTDHGKSPASNKDTATPVRVIVLPGSPTGITATKGDGEVTLSWTAPSSFGSAALLRYDYRYGSGSNIAEEDYTEWESAGTETSVTIDDLTNGTAYRFQKPYVHLPLQKLGANQCFL